jgi:hypothetical protein
MGVPAIFENANYALLERPEVSRPIYVKRDGK